MRKIIVKTYLLFNIKQIITRRPHIPQDPSLRYPKKGFITKGLATRVVTRSQRLKHLYCPQYHSSTRVKHKIVDAVIGHSNYIRCICFLLKTLLFLNRIIVVWHWLKDRALSMKQGTKNVMLALVVHMIILFLQIKRANLPGLKISPCTLV